MLKYQCRDAPKQESDCHASHQANQEIQTAMSHGRPGHFRPDEFRENFVQHQHYRIAQHRLPKAEVKHQGVDFQTLEDTENSHGIGRGNQGSECQTLRQRHVQRRARLPQTIQGETNEGSGDDGAHDGIQHGRHKVVKEHLPLQGVARVENDGREETDEEDCGADAGGQPLLGLAVRGENHDATQNGTDDDNGPRFRHVFELYRSRVSRKKGVSAE